MGVTQLSPWLVLMRLHQPVGIYLVMWPALIGLFDAALLTTGGMPTPWLVAAFVLGAILSRSAGCIANDLWDRDLDPGVERTRNRPLASGQIRPRAALLLMLALFAGCALIAWMVDPLVFLVALIALPFIILYPLAKRFTGHPQAILSLSFNLGIPMAYAAQGLLFTTSWLPLFLANMAWIYAYDTIYAMADKPDDARLGIGSSALSWGRIDWLAVALFQALTLALLIWWWRASAHGLLMAVALGVTALGFIAQQWRIRRRSISHCVLAFRSNHWLQACILLALLAEQSWP